METDHREKATPAPRMQRCKLADYRQSFESIWRILVLVVLLGPIQLVLAQEAGEVVSVLGVVEVLREGRWEALKAGEVLSASGVVRTAEGSRAALYLANGSQIKLNANCQLELKDIAPASLKPAAAKAVQSVLRVLKGEIWVRSNGLPLEIQSMPVVATIRGTEFTFAVDAAQVARLAVVDGVVDFHNPQGRVSVAANEQATARPGEAPRKTVLLDPLDAVQWSLYYPALPEDRADRARGRLFDPRSSDYWTEAARAHLLRGQVPDARQALDRALALDEKDARAYSLRALIDLVQNRKAEARANAERAVAADPRSPVAYLSLSWVQQAEFDLDAALVSARQAVALAPDNPHALIQESRLRFGMGQSKQALKLAERARQRAPDDALINSTWGFLQLAQGHTKAAQQAFQTAIQQDSTLGEPHLGLGLALFRQNRTEEAVAALEKATLLEPKVSLYNSYLGKAYFEVKDDRRAEKALAQAKQLDPRDPTPHFYDALRLQAANSPVQAVQSLQRSMDLNDNRAVYRSKFLLDEDLAARAASLGRSYNEIGFNRLGLKEATKSVALDPINHSAHRLLADSYSMLPRHEVAKASELLQSQLLQPFNVTPVQAQLAETKLLVLSDAGPLTSSLHEYNSLFRRDKTSILASGLIGSNNTLGDEFVLSGISGNFSYSLGQFHYTSDGFRENNDLQHNIYNLFAQTALTPNFNIQAEFRKRNTEYGDLLYNFNLEDFSPHDRVKVDQDTMRLGAHWKPSPRSDFVASLIYRDKQENKFQVTEQNLYNLRNEINVAAKDSGHQLEAQYYFHSDNINLIAGIGNYDIDVEQLLSKASFINSIPNPPQDPTPYKFARKKSNAYFYMNVAHPENLIWTLGISYENFKEADFKLSTFYPKFGLLWNIDNNTQLRFAAFRTIKPALIIDQTIEPTQVSGFNQFLDDHNGTQSQQFGVGFDKRLTDNLHVGIEALRRDTKTPIFNIDNDNIYFKYNKEGQQNIYRAYLYWIPAPRWTIGFQYQYEKYTHDMHPEDTDPNEPTRLETTALPLKIHYSDPTGFFSELEGAYIHQKVVRNPTPSVNDDGLIESDLPTLDFGKEEFFLLNSMIGYHFANNRGIFRIVGLNLLDNKFKFQDMNFLTAEVANPYPYFIPERILSAQITFNF